MLVLSRKKGESIMIGDGIELIVLGTEGDTVKIGINAPKQVEVYRKEVYLAIQQSNREASRSSMIGRDLSGLIRKTEK
ncbi:carbon storage regulator CsrA [Paenibacillus sp. CC-CFT747]|nr:carbon storage regulator CsrA [Paenibacillus sp. CC-CFT747]